MPTMSKLFLRSADGRFHDHGKVFHKYSQQLPLRCLIGIWRLYNHKVAYSQNMAVGMDAFLVWFTVTREVWSPFIRRRRFSFYVSTTYTSPEHPSPTLRPTYYIRVLSTSIYFIVSFNTNASQESSRMKGFITCSSWLIRGQRMASASGLQRTLDFFCPARNPEMCIRRATRVRATLEDTGKMMCAMPVPTFVPYSV